MGHRKITGKSGGLSPNFRSDVAKLAFSMILKLLNEHEITMIRVIKLK